MNGNDELCSRCYCYWFLGSMRICSVLCVPSSVRVFVFCPSVFDICSALWACVCPPVSSERAWISSVAEAVTCGGFGGLEPTSCGKALAIGRSLVDPRRGGFWRCKILIRSRSCVSCAYNNSDSVELLCIRTICIQIMFSYRPGRFAVK